MGRSIAGHESEDLPVASIVHWFRVESQAGQGFSPRTVVTDSASVLLMQQNRLVARVLKWYTGFLTVAFF
jgi:hypothetical protein